MFGVGLRRKPQSVALSEESHNLWLSLLTPITRKRQNLSSALSDRCALSNATVADLNFSLDLLCCEFGLLNVEEMESCGNTTSSFNDVSTSTNMTGEVTFRTCAPSFR